MKEKGLKNNFRIRYFSKCLNSSGSLLPTNKCHGLKVGETVEFEIELELLSCPQNQSEYDQTFQIYPVGMSNDALTIDVHMICDCDCQRPGHQVS